MVETCKTCNARLEGGLEYKNNDQCRLCLLEEVVMELKERVIVLEVHTL